MAQSDAPILRHATPDDYPALYHISVVTGDAGQDARALLTDHTLIGAIYSVPYAIYEPTLTWVAEDEIGVLGYVVGTRDTRAFEARLDREWFPAIRSRTDDPMSVAKAHWTGDQKELMKIHHPSPVPEPVVARYPAHMHMNLLPRARGTGLGRRLFTTWATKAKSMGADGVHIGAALKNTTGQAFWSAMGFEKIKHAGDTGAVWMGQNLRDLPLPQASEGGA